MPDPRSTSGKRAAVIVALPLGAALLLLGFGTVHDLFLRDWLLDREFKQALDLAGLRDWAREVAMQGRLGPLPAEDYPPLLARSDVELAAVTAQDDGVVVVLRIGGKRCASGDLLFSDTSTPLHPQARSLIPGVWRVPWHGR